MPRAPDPAVVAAVEDAIVGRRSIRAFRSDPVAADLVGRLLDVAARAPSGTNMQPWRVHALAGDAKTALSEALNTARDAPGETHEAEYKYYPDAFFEPYQSRRRKVGWDLYGLLGIAKGDAAAMHRQHGRNMLFFDAPVGLIFTIDRRLEIGSWLDYGMFIQSLMVAARAHGLATCVQAAFAPYHAVIRRHLALDPSEVVICGLSLGYADEAAPENTLVTTRVPAGDFTSFRGFEPADAT